MGVNQSSQGKANKSQPPSARREAANGGRFFFPVVSDEERREPVATRCGILAFLTSWLFLHHGGRRRRFIGTAGFGKRQPH
jgi:hypothetical protein